MSVPPAKIETLRKVATMLKAIAIAKATKFVISEVKKFDVNLAMDKGTSKLVLTIQRKK
jgi:hypothetical protein